MKRAAFLFALFLTLSACSRSIQKTDVVGVYVLQNKAALFTLEIKTDGTYVHILTRKDGSKITRTGKWEWDEKEEDNKMCLDAFEVFPEEDIGVADVPGFFILHPEWSSQGIQFPVGDPDSPSHYFKPQK